MSCFNEEWREFIHECHRDQLSFDYLIQKHNVTTLRMPFKSKPCNKVKHVNPKNRRLLSA